MREMNGDPVVASPLHEITSAATQFGLSSQEVLAAMNEALSFTGIDSPVSDYLDELSGMLARRILAKERQLRFGG
jgi:hypothetical protein